MAAEGPSRCFEGFGCLRCRSLSRLIGDDVRDDVRDGFPSVRLVEARTMIQVDRNEFPTKHLEAHHKSWREL